MGRVPGRRRPRHVPRASCGEGRHAGPLGARTHRPVVGLDRDPLSLTQRAPHFLPLRADLRQLPFRTGSLAGAVAFYASLFGSLEDDEIAATLKETARSLRPGGRLLLQTVPLERFLEEPTAEIETVLPDGSVLFERSSFDPQTGRDQGFRRLSMKAGEDGRTLSGHYFIRYYSLPQLTCLLEGAGFVVRWIHGDVYGGPLFSSSRDLIIGADRHNA